MDLNAYLKRIHYDGLLEPSPAVLRDLQLAHLYSVPFENLDVQRRQPVRLDEAGLFDKIVTRRRGGFCYELNGLFALLLEGLGFGVERLNARGVEDDGSYAREFDHLALRARCPAEPGVPLLVDVGWGSGPLEPLRLDIPGDQRQGERLFRFIAEGAYRVLAEQAARPDGSPGWIKHYAFTPRAYRLDDFDECCRYHQTSPESLFRRKRLVTLYLPDGRVTLSESRLITTRAGTRDERELGGEDEVAQVLAERFGLVLEESPRP